MPPLPGHWHSLLARHGKIWKAAYKEITQALEAKLAGRGTAQVEYATVRSSQQSINAASRARQGRASWLNTGRHLNDSARYFSTEARSGRSGAGKAHATYKSATWTAIKQSPGRAPFASTLRPNATGGTLGRTAGGYSLGGGRVGGPRYFSHGPTSQAQVIQNVSQAVRAFMLGGQKAQFNGVDPITGNKRFKAVTKLQHEAGRKMQSVARTTPGSHVDFSINPTVTALTPLKHITGFSEDSDSHLNTEGLLDVLSADFSRSLKELAAVLSDLRRLSALGDLPITYEHSCLRIHFPGCDAETVEKLCRELNVKRGIVVQDEDFDAYTGTEMALLFPFAPSKPGSDAGELFEATPVKPAPYIDQIEWKTMMSTSSVPDRYSTQSETGLDDFVLDDPWRSSEHGQDDHYSHVSDGAYSSQHSPLEYQGIEGIYRFIEQCDTARRV